MQSIKKQFVTDENLKPVAVIINYQDWQKIEALLQQQEEKLLSQLESTEAVVWSPQVDQSAVQALSDLKGEQEDSTESFKALAAYAGSIQLTIDPLEYQSETRNSWL
ncbi:conserved hypothetical protein [Microcystis aeruginosa PCC 9807]|uniref:Uncharacterized protein n=1 Tax=Microcystis aeruginosa PCC 9807 TaxID=1160283 RepID=I4GZ64_MICAE|nr:hypothetical protein [Microcystis aeruginosa]CCI15088.1 conserved hypothetical protein [Microcystis aeruginosa PCC 9807]